MKLLKEKKKKRKVILAITHLGWNFVLTEPGWGIFSSVISKKIEHLVYNKTHLHIENDSKIHSILNPFNYPIIIIIIINNNN